MDSSLKRSVKDALAPGKGFTYGSNFQSGDFNENCDTSSLQATKTNKAAEVVSGAGGTGVPLICVCILIVELCERLAFYTFTGTQESYLEHNGYTLGQAGGINASMSTLCMAWALAAGWMADAVLGRYWTITIFGLVYALGAFLSTIAAWPGLNSTRLYLTGIMFFIPMGTAGIKANISNFGADQYDVSDPAQAKAQEKFFSWFYLAINLGSAVAYGYLTTMGSNGGLGVDKEHGYFAVYLIAAVCMFGAVCLFVSGKAHYRMQPVMECSPLGNLVKHITRASERGSSKATSVRVSCIALIVCVVASVVGSIMPDAPCAQPCMYLAFFCAMAGVVGLVVPCLEPSWVLSEPVPDEQVQPSEAHAFLKLLPTLVMGNLAFSAIYNCMQYWYQQQACQMDVRVPFTGGSSQFAGSFFMIADCLGIVVATPIAMNYVNPALERSFAGGFGTGAKYGVGMAFGGLSVLVATTLELHRKNSPVMHGVPSNCAPNGVEMSQTSAIWMFLPFLFMGIGEIYTQPVLMHFAYKNSPTSLRTLASVTSLVIGAISNALFTVQIAALSPFVKDDLNKGHLEYGYYMNLVLGVAVYIVFMHVLKCFERS
jgi:peptide/histidine transporter 3/4